MPAKFIYILVLVLILLELLAWHLDAICQFMARWLELPEESEIPDEIEVRYTIYDRHQQP